MPCEEPVTSTRNQHAVRMRKLAQKKHRVREGLTLIEGARVLRAALDAGTHIASMLVDEDFMASEDNAALVRRAAERGARIIPADPAVIESVGSVATSQGFVAAARLPSTRLGDVMEAASLAESRGRSLVLIADRISDPGNLGNLIRTASALGCAGYATTTGTVDAFSPRVIRASAGTVFAAPGVEAVPTDVLLDELRQRGYLLVASAPDGDQPLDRFAPPSRIALLVGEEGAGLASDMLRAADVTLRIPMIAGAESLNVGSAAAIFLYAFSPLRDAQ